MQDPLIYLAPPILRAYRTNAFSNPEKRHEDQGEAKELRASPPAVLMSSGPPGLSPGSSLYSLELPPGVYSQGDEGTVLWRWIALLRINIQVLKQVRGGQKHF